ncbi:ribosomal protein S18 acetylase RimI-like enzyme [Kribbella sp. VKM Ac-2527]|uniref:Ribosomal protein S18 acetylase RimI-like enzyme n=2 Tax=Kribbella caucasensis TaxID=2512215 RepID=A0A4R6KDU1_9ACTN|nr:ribosomal protein S18 acetylase RimI-like enzyme [Kribbella sp. VKM Ac-2527]
MLAAYNTALIGIADGTVDDVADRIVEPGFDRRSDGFLVLAGDGLPVGYGTAFGRGDRQVVGIQVWSQKPTVADWLFEQTLQRAREMGRERGHAEITVDSDVYRADESLRALLADHDFTASTTYQRMRIDHTGPVATPEEPADVVVRRGAFDDATRWTAHEIIIDSFRGQLGFVARPHEEWIEYLEATASFDWSQITLLEIDGRAVAIRICNNEFVETENCGSIGMLAVLDEFRGRGLAKFLLREAFARDAADGRAGTILNVDTDNSAPALGLYLSVGMNPTLVSDGWCRILPVN